MTALISKPGITNASVLAIPKEWDAKWWRNFVGSQLKGADVRNAVGANGIVVSGTLASPFATISIGNGASNPIAGPLFINDPTAGTNALTVTANGATVTDAGINRAAVFLGRPNSFTVDIFGDQVNSGQSFGLAVRAGSTSGDSCLTLLNAAGATMVNVNGIGDVIINAPTSASIALQVTGFNGSSIFQTTANASSTTQAWNAIGGAAGAVLINTSSSYFSTGTTAPVLTANKPGATTSILGWLKVSLNGTAGWIPVWAN